MFDEMLEQEYEFDYLRPELTYLPRWARRSAEFRNSIEGRLDVAYGGDMRERLDYFPAPDAAVAPTIVFIHGGAWQRGDKSFYSFLAESFLAKGISFLALTYNFCPALRISDIVGQIAKAMLWLDGNVGNLGGDRNKLILAGHSAGAHLAGMMMTAGHPDFGPVSDLFKGAILLSGIFDLTPLLATSLGEAMNLELEEARSCSPALRSAVFAGRQLVGCGGEESSEFKRQSDAYANIFTAAGGKAEIMDVPGNHFDIIDELASRRSTLFKAVLRIVDGL